MEGKGDDTKVRGVYLSKGKYIQDIHDQVCMDSESTEVVDDNTNHRGASMVFLIMNSIHTWKSARVMRTTTHYVERFLRMPSNSDDIEERDGEQKVSSVLG